MPTDLTNTRLLDYLRTAILVIEPDLSVSYINAAAEVLLEVSGSRVLGESIERLLREESHGSAASLRQALLAGEAYAKRETKLTLPSGQEITVDYALTPISYVQGGDAGPVIMEIQALDRLLRISREEGLISSQQNTRLLIRGLAHEIKNPLGGLRGAAQLLARELHDEGLREFTSIIIEEADRLRNLVDRMLGPNTVCAFKPTNIHEVSERVLQLVQVELGDPCPIALHRDYDPSIPEFPGDSERIIQALLNVVRNAMQALQERGTANPEAVPSITLRTRILRQFTIGMVRHRLVCRLDVEDNGQGIPDELQQHIFFPMVSGRAEGTGLGLSIAQSIINQHHGLIECQSRPGHTVFSLFIPLEQRDESNQ